MTELDIRLQELALMDFQYFCELTGVDKKKASVCLLVVGGASLGQISIRLQIPKSTIRNIVKKCKANKKSIPIK